MLSVPSSLSSHSSSCSVWRETQSTLRSYLLPSNPYIGRPISRDHSSASAIDVSLCVIWPGASTTCWWVYPAAKMDAKTLVGHSLWMIGELPHLRQKWLRRDDSVAFTDVFWPRESALLLLFGARWRGIQKQVLVGSVFNRKSSRLRWMTKQLVTTFADSDYELVDDGTD